MNHKQETASNQDTDCPNSGRELHAIQIKVPEDLYRAFQRCIWVQVNETGRSQLDIMEEVVEDFLKKHGC
ncbi:MAG: hypothetical protein ACLFV2_03445 [Desulfurivibrionaceae bacterium]